MSRYQHLTPAGEGSTHIFTYNLVSGFTHISDISDQFPKKHLFWVTYRKARFIQNIIIYLVLTIYFTEAYQRSRYRIERSEERRVGKECA